MSPLLCLYHDSCTDGFAAAWAVRHGLVGVAAEFKACKYGDPRPTDILSRHVVIVDFSYPRAVLETMALEAAGILVLDHHKTAMEDLAPLTTGAAPDVTGWQRDPDGLHVHFDMKRSGAGMAWDFFHPGEARPWLIDMVEVRDLWLKDDKRFEKAKIVHAYLNSFAFDFGEWDEHHRLTSTEEGQERVIHDGAAIARIRQKDARDAAIMSARWIDLGAFKGVRAINLPPFLASDACDYLIGHGERMVASYYDGNGYRYFSLRSAKGGPDVGAIARTYGGGGHENAAGFRVLRDDPLAQT
jgi:oligoribonuclease NrnB/cAMP/cGMP phosphodiesterase (DHH superfamily)